MFYMDNRCQTNAVFLKFSIPICTWMYLVCKSMLWTTCWIPREQLRISWHQQCKDLPIVSYLFGLGKCSNVLQSAQKNILKNKALTVMTMTIVMMIMAILIKIIMTTYDDGSWEGNANTLLACMKSSSKPQWIMDMLGLHSRKWKYLQPPTKPSNPEIDVLLLYMSSPEVSKG